MAAVECPNKEQYITAITHELDESTKEEIAAIIKANQVCGIQTPMLVYITDHPTGITKSN
jgi:hypothetical protein